VEDYIFFLAEWGLGAGFAFGEDGNYGFYVQFGQGFEK